ncbi:MAG: hypothetical protein RL134_1721 [Actinomycetota bacterium]
MVAAVVATSLAASGITAVSAAPVQVMTSTSPSGAYAVLKVISTGTGARDVAVNDADDTVYVSNTLANTLSIISSTTGPTVLRTIPVGSAPRGVAVHQVDDTVYVVNTSSNSMSAINGRNVDDSRVVPVGAGPQGVAINVADDTVYVANSSSSSLWALRGASLDDSVAVGVGLAPESVAVDQGDDTVYVTNSGNPGTLSVLSGRPLAVTSTVTVGQAPAGVAVDNADDTIYVARGFGSSIAVVPGRSLVASSVGVGSGPLDVAVDQSDDTIYVSNYNNDYVSVINGRNADDSVAITVGSTPAGIAVDQAGINAGLAYVTRFMGNTLTVIGRATPSASPSSGQAAATVTIALTVPHLAPGFVMDDTTVQSVSFGGVPGTGLVAGAGDTWSVTVPAGSGTVPITVSLNGGQTAGAGSFTYVSPTPPPVFPPSAPLGVTAVSSDSSADISWVPPTSAGSYPISTYQATAAPGGATCLVAAPATSCRITGLTNGVAYTATVRALNGAGWGPESSPSAQFTPGIPSIVISGTRGTVRGKPGIIVTGVSTGLAKDAVLRPWFRFAGAKADTEGVAVIRVGEDGSFTWKRSTGKTIYVTVKTSDATVVSNRIVIRR